MRTLSREEKFGLGITSVIHTVVVLTALFVAAQPRAMERTAFIEVTLGEFQDGALAEFSREEEVRPETRPDPVETVAEAPEPEPDPTPQPAQQPRESARDVELPEQEQDIREEVVATPDTEQIDPQQQPEQTREAEETAAPKLAQQDDVAQQGEEETGDIRGIRGRPDVDQGTSTDPIRSAPFQLEWEGDVNRTPMVQPMPDFVSQTEAVISVRFEVRPDGTVGRLQPIIKGDPQLEREVLRTLRSWRFSRLSANMPQESQYGTVTFRFVLE